MTRTVSSGATALASLIVLGTLAAGGYAAITGHHILHSTGAQQRGQVARQESSQRFVRPGGEGLSSRYGSPDSRATEEAADQQAETRPRRRVTEWVVYEGTLAAMDPHLVLKTDGHQTIPIGIGPGDHRESLDTSLSVGDRISATGFLEDGEFKARDLTNSTTGEGVILRDESGRPAWAGQGRRRGA